jgi:hypothetical protein
MFGIVEQCNWLGLLLFLSFSSFSFFFVSPPLRGKWEYEGNIGDNNPPRVHIKRKKGRVGLGTDSRAGLGGY